MDDTKGTYEDVGLKFKSYLRTTKGQIYAGEIAICILILICYIFRPDVSYIGVCITELVSAAVFCTIFVLELDKQIHFIHWQVSDFIRAVSGCLYFLITSLILVIHEHSAAGIIVGLIGFVATVLFVYDAYFIFKYHLKTGRQQSPGNQMDQPAVANLGT